MQTIELFRSHEFRATAKIHNDDPNRSIFVVFDYFNGDIISDKRDLDGLCFGENFFLKYEIDAVFIRPRSNDWYQNPQILELLDSVRELTRKRSHVFTYGESMGGYAALRHAAFLDATAVALAPQYSVNPLVSPFENRWHGTDGIVYAVEQKSPSIQNAGAFIIYDPRHTEDAAHAGMIRADMPDAIPLQIPYLGHLISPYLAYTGLLKSLIIDLNDGKFCQEDFLKKAIHKRRESSQYFERLSRAQERSRPTWALSIARHAYSLHSDVIQAHNLSRQLARNQMWSEAISVARQVCADFPQGLAYRKYLGMLLSKKKTTASEAARIFENVIEIEPGVSDHYLWLAKAQLRSGKLFAARDAALSAQNYATNPVQLRLAAKLRRKILGVMIFMPWRLITG